jgi:hypothetical protein
MAYSAKAGSASAETPSLLASWSATNVGVLASAGEDGFADR